MSFDNQFDNQIIYVGDPMCSWCWGISNEFEYLKNQYKSTLEIKIIMGGLRPGPGENMDQETKDFIRHHWEQVNKTTGQSFNYSLLEPNTKFIYDTEVPSRSVIIIREENPAITFDFFKDIQSAFYTRNENTNNVETYLSLLTKYEVDKNQFLKKFESANATDRSYQDFQLARQLGVTG